MRRISDSVGANRTSRDCRSGAGAGQIPRHDGKLAWPEARRIATRERFRSTPGMALGWLVLPG